MVHQISTAIEKIQKIFQIKTIFSISDKNNILFDSNSYTMREKRRIFNNNKIYQCKNKLSQSYWELLSFNVAIYLSYRKIPN